MARYSKEELDEEFEKFMKELSDESFENSNKTLRQPQKEVKKKDALPWWLTEDDLEDDRLLETNVSYVKTKKISQPLTDIEEESAERIQFLKSSGTSILSIDSLETNEIVSDLNHSVLGLGLDTLEEQEEKEQFFARLEKGLTSSIDYSRLNKELDYNDSTHFKDLQSSQANIKLTEELTEDKHESESKHEELSENYSDDFEHEDIDISSAAKDEEINSKENSEKINVPTQEEEKTGMLANVVLIDSLDSVGETNLAEDKATTEPLTLPEITGNGMVGTALSYGQSNSDIEALHQAYHHIAHSLGDGGEERVGSTEMGNIKSLVKEHSQENEGSSKNLSTTESDLPTVEELMRPIRIDSLGINHFDFKPVSYKKLAGSQETEFMSPFPREVTQNLMSQEPQNVNQFPHRTEERVVLQRATNEDKENSGPGVSTMEECIDKTCLDILRKKISVAPSLLPQDNKVNKTLKSQLSSEEGTAADKQVPYKKARSAPPLLKRKPQSGLYASVRSSGYGKPSSPFKTFSTLEKKTSKDIMKSKNLRSIPTSNQARKKEIFSETKLIKPAAQNKPSPKNEVFLTVPMKSKDNTEVDSCGRFKNDSSDYQSGNKETELVLFKRVQEAEEKWRGAQALIEQIKVTFSEKERGLEDKMEELKRQQEKELLKLNQENYILQSKLNSFEETNRKQKWLHFEATDSITEEKLKHIQKEIQEQETLLQGYQQENERLYKQVKDLQEQNKKNEERMFKENQNLFSELASLKEQMHKNHFLSQVVEDSEPTRNQSFTDLLAELRLAQKEKSSLLEDIKRLKQDKQALEVDLEKMKKERDQAKDQIAYATGEKLYEIKILEDTHKQEVARLQKRLQWYAENQELLDKDAVRLKEAHEEIEKLKLEVEKLKTESGNPSLPQKMRSKDRAADAKKIQDLERQVKEMEGILKRRYPNSLPALILAASAAGDTVERSTVEFMEKRIKKLEADLEGKDEEAKKSLRTMEQQFQKMKIQYEQRAEEQEKLLACKLKEVSQHQCDDSRAKALEEELREIKEAHRVTVTNLEAEIDVLKHQNAKPELKKNDEDDKGVQSIEFQVEQAHAKARMARLSEELAAKSREIQTLSKTVERLQKERRVMLSRQNPKSREEVTSKSAKRDAPQPGRGGSHASSGTQNGKLYQPSNFTGSRLSEVLQENCRLRDELEGLISERDELQKKSETTMRQLENSIKRVKEDTTAHITSLKASHQREIEKLLCQNALENSSSKVAELNRKIASQEVLIKHFQSQVNELQEKQESLAVSQVREEILQKEITKLIEELKEAKENHTPEMKHFTGLEKKIKQMEVRHEQREQELQRIIQQTRQVVETEQNKEIEKWKRLAQLKNRELDHFRRELDSILDVLRELHQQGVVVPVAFADEISGPEYY